MGEVLADPNEKEAKTAAAVSAPAVASDDGKEFSSAFAEAAKAKAAGRLPAPITEQVPDPQGAAVVAAAETTGTGVPEPAGAAADKGDKGASAPAKSKADPFAKATPEQRDAYSSRGQEIARLRNKVHELKKTTSSAPASGTTAPATAAASTPGTKTERASKRADKLKEVTEDFPSVAAPIAAVLQDQDDEISELRDQIASLARTENTKTETEILEGDHEDWKAVVSSQDFADWALAAPKYVQDVLARNGEHIVNGVEAADVIGRYKLETSQRGNGATQAAGAAGESSPAERLRKHQAAAGAAPAVAGGAGAAQGAPDDDFSANFREASRKRAEERQQQRMGRR